jgi:hypothetical protein
VLAGVTAAALCTTALVTVAAGPAAAAMGKGRAQICAQGDYDSWLEFRGSQTFNSSYVSSPGFGCVNVTIPPGTYQLAIIGLAEKPGTLPTAVVLGTYNASPSTNPGVKAFTSGSFSTSTRPPYTVTR